jgi:hypothetical protein
MSVRQGYYALLQYSAMPERFEYVNIGVALFLPRSGQVFSRFSMGLRRVERMFGKQPHGYISVLKSDFEARLARLEVSNLETLDKFANSRANKIRIANINPVLVQREPEDELNELFDMLVGEDEVIPRRRKVASELKDKFEVAGVEHYLDKPAPIELPQGITIDAPFAYQNGSYNLIDPVRLGESSDAIGLASERAVKGQWLRQVSARMGVPKQLVVVGDFSQTDDKFRHAVEEMMREHSVTLYDFDRVEPLVEDIRRYAKLHG